MDPFQRVVFATCVDVGTPRALTVMLLVRHGEWAQLARLRTDPNWYSDSESYFRDVLVTDLLRKCDLPSGIDREGEARSLFWVLEAQNARTNVRLSRYLPKSLFLETAQEVAVHDFIGRWRKEVKRIVGSLPYSLTPRFSSGATFADVGQLITTPDKMSSRPTIYSQSRDALLPFWEETSWFRSVVTERCDSDPRTVRGNVFFTVPKDAKSFRGCCKEASLNVSYQLDLGRLLKTRLKERAGIDLRNGQSVHKEAARAASLTGSHSTIDLSSASDTMCRNVVQLILPDDWFDLLSSLRASHTWIGKKWVRLEKFSSMGNGFTFELESLLFYTLAKTILGDREGDILCYGDDLIVPSFIHDDLVSSLRFFGFEPNKKKTYAVGPFRESCGGDFFSGVPVRGHFVKELPNEPQHWIALANGLRRAASIDGAISPIRWNYLRRAWHICLDAIPSHIRRCRGPSSLGDIVIHDDPDRWHFVPPPSSPKHLHHLDEGHDPSWELRYVKAYVPIPVILSWHHWKASVQLASCTLGYPSDGITPRGGVAGYRLSTVGATLTGNWVPSR